MTRHARREQGTALIACLLSIFVLMMAGSSMLSLTLFRESSAKGAKDVDTAQLLADTGVDCALYEMDLAHDYAADGIGNASGTLSGGTYLATVSPVFAGSGEYTITSTGTIHSVHRTVMAYVGKTLVRTGFIGKTSITMSGGLVDSYNSGTGTYASQVSGGFAGSAGRLASNGNIALSGSATIKGDATPGPGMAVTGATSLVSGSIAPAATAQILPPVVYAPPIAATGAFSGTTTFAGGQHRFTSFTVPGGKIVTFTGDVELYVDGAFTISGSGKAILQSTGTVKIYHGTGDFTLSGGGVINQDQKPSNLQVVSATTGKMVYSGSAALYGSVYAPASQGTVSGSAGVYGAFQTDTLTISGGANLHYDDGLGTTSARFVLRAVRPKVY